MHRAILGGLDGRRDDLVDRSTRAFLAKSSRRGNEQLIGPLCFTRASGSATAAGGSTTRRKKAVSNVHRPIARLIRDARLQSSANCAQGPLTRRFWVHPTHPDNIGLERERAATKRLFLNGPANSESCERELATDEV
jgi:hypothetical protein